MSFNGKGKSRIPDVAEKECTYLESIFPLKNFAHLTTAQRVSLDHLRSLFLEWILGIQRHHEMTVGWVRSIEHFPKLHIHAALIAVRPIDCEYAAALWQAMASPRYSEAARVEPYLVGKCGLGYILKELGRPRAEIGYSDYIEAFSTLPAGSIFPTTPQQRRQYRRIRAQVANAKRSLQLKERGCDEDNQDT